MPDWTNVLTCDVQMGARAAAGAAYVADVQMGARAIAANETGIYAVTLGNTIYDIGAGLRTVYVATGTHVGRTRDFGAGGGAAWTDITDAIVGTICDMVLDPWDPKNTAYAFSRVGAASNTSGLWKTTNLNAAAPVWVLKKTITSMEADGGDASRQNYTKLACSINWENYIAFFYYFGDATLNSGRRMWCWHSHDGGNTWTAARIYNGGTFMKWRGAANILSHEIGGQLYLYCALGRGTYGIAQYCHYYIMRSIDHGHTWSLWLTPWGNWTWASNIPSFYTLDVPYNDNDDGDSLYWPLCNSVEHLATYRTYRLRDGVWANVQPAAVSQMPNYHRHSIEASTHDRDRLYCFVHISAAAGYRLYTSINGGTNWTDLGLTSVLGLGKVIYASAGLPYNNQLFYALATNGIFYSIDGGASWNDATGNWVAAIGAFGTGRAITPMWLE